MSWVQIWKDQGLNEDGSEDIDPTLTAEEWKAQCDKIMDDLEQNYEVVYERDEDGLEHPIIRRK